MGFKVEQKYRTNDLSFHPGGHIVIVQLKDGRQFEYDNIKNPEVYMRVVKKNSNVKDAWVKK